METLKNQTERFICNYTIIKQMEIETETRKWGNSLGITIPKKVIEAEHLLENQRVIVEIKRVVDIRKLKGILNTPKTTQQLKDEMRSGWE